MRILYFFLLAQSFGIISTFDEFDYTEMSNCFNSTKRIYEYVRPGSEYQPNFKVFSKIIVNGDDEDPIFTFLKNACPSPNGYIGRQFTYLWELMRNNDINWNFAKFLLDHNGIPYKRYMPIVHPLRIRNDIQYLIK
ncbi:hypothetical protein MXB_3053, partial [Myxobolus squamalis]